MHVLLTFDSEETNNKIVHDSSCDFSAASKVEYKKKLKESISAMRK